MSDKLMELARRVEGLSGPDREVDEDILRALGYTWRGMAYWHADDRRTWSAPTHFTASIDAALTLVPDRWFWRVGHSTLYAGWAHLNRVHPDSCNREDEHSAQASTPALALCAAALRSRASMGDGE